MEFFFLFAFSRSYIEGCENYTDVWSYGESGAELEMVAGSPLCLEGNFLCFGDKITAKAAYFVGSKYDVSDEYSNVIGVTGKETIFDEIRRPSYSKLTVSKNQKVLIFPIKPSLSSIDLLFNGKSHSTNQDSIVTTMKNYKGMITSQSISSNARTLIQNIKFINTNLQNFTFAISDGAKMIIDADGEKKTITTGMDVPSAKVLTAKFEIPINQDFMNQADMKSVCGSQDPRIPEFTIRIPSSNIVLTTKYLDKSNDAPYRSTYAEFGVLITSLVAIVVAVVLIVIGINRFVCKPNNNEEDNNTNLVENLNDDIAL